MLYVNQQKMNKPLNTFKFLFAIEIMINLKFVNFRKTDNDIL